METWKDIIGFEGVYQISNKGNVKSLDRTEKTSKGIMVKRKGKVLKQIPNSNGYLRVVLNHEGKREKWFVHRLVAVHFVDNDDPLTNIIVNHLDSNYLNNSAENLEWTTMKGNSQHALLTGRMARTEQWLNRLHKSQEKYYKPVEAYNVDTGEVIAVFKGIQECKRFGYDPSCVCECCKGNRKSHKGLGWRYMNGGD